MKKQDLNNHLQMIGKKVFTLDGNQIFTGIVTNVKINADKKNTTATYLVSEVNSNNEFSYSHEVCFNSLAALFVNLKQTLSQRQSKLFKERKTISQNKGMSFLRSH